MHQNYNNKLQREVLTIHPGEYYVSVNKTVISTVLGSCVAVAFWDKKLKFGGLNHFMLPGELSKKHIFVSSAGKYGMFAMELVINEMLKAGSRKQNLIAKVFGGGSVLSSFSGLSTKVPEDNIRFALNYLAEEHIQIESSNLGGNFARKIFFFPENARVLMKKITGTLIEKIEDEEAEYYKNMHQRIEENGNKNVVLFPKK